MSFADLSNVYLRIGTRHRRRQNERGATKLGDKGIGRLSAMRLGDRLTVETTKAGERRWNLLKVNWGILSHSKDMLVQDIQIAPKRGSTKRNPNQHGTTIRIRSLNADWTWVRFNELLDGKIARFMDPFEAGFANRLLLARHNGRRAMIPSIPKALLKHAHATCRATVSSRRRGPGGRGQGGLSPKATSDNYRGSRIGGDGAQSELLGSAARNAGTRPTRRRRISRDALVRLGGFDLEIYWYNRQIVDSIEGLTENKAASRAEIARWSGGPMLYRYGFRVLPFGDPDDDWISLDKRAFASAGFKLNRQQIIGRIRIQDATQIPQRTDQSRRLGSVRGVGRTDATGNVGCTGRVSQLHQRGR